MKVCKMNLCMFGMEDDRDFFTSAFNEAYSITDNTEAPSEPVEEPVSDSVDEVEETPVETTPEPYNPNDEELRRLYEERFGVQEEEDEKEEDDTPVYDEKTQSALELYKYLEQNPHLVQAMRNVDMEGYKNLNNFVPDELTKKVKEMEDFIEEQRYEKYVNGLKNKYSDFDEDKVLEYAEKHDVLNLEVAYKAMKAENVKEPDIEELRKQIKEELLNELKQNSLETQSIVGGISQKPIKQDDTVNLSNRELRIAKAMGLSPSEYAKWR